jgi:hypothetical protein
MTEPMDDAEMLAIITDAAAGLDPTIGWAAIEDHVSAVIAERNQLRAVARAADALLDADRTSWSPEHAALAAALGEGPTPVDPELARLRADIKAERDINLASGCPDCGVHDGCYRVVAERDRLRAAVEGALLAIETTLTGDNVDMKATTGELLGRTSAALKQALHGRATDG